MKIVLATNYSLPSIGGCEMIVHQIAKRMVKDFSHECLVLSFSAKNQVIDGVKYEKISNMTDLLSKIYKFKANHLFIYSDEFKLLENVFDCIRYKIHCSVSLATVGMKQMFRSNKILNKFLNKKDLIGTIVHSKKYYDYEKLKLHQVNPVVIPNAVDLDEFDNNKEVFNRPDCKYFIICVANFFPGKGQEFLPTIQAYIPKISQDIKIGVFHTTPVNGNVKMYEESTLQKIKSKYVLSYANTPRDQLISAYHEADLCVFPTQKEVSPVVFLEAMAAKKPWVALPVGNVPELKGGAIVSDYKKNNEGYFVYTKNTHKMFADYIYTLLTDKKVYKKMSEEGRDHVVKHHNWSIVAKKYNDFFVGEFK